MSKIALIPYWLKDSPLQIKQTDNHWWFAPLLQYDILIFVGPGLASSAYFKQEEGPDICTIKVRSLHFSLKNVEIELFDLSQDIAVKDISLIWHVLEMTATCRISDLAQFHGHKIALIGDTHHLQNPISGLIPYINQSGFQQILCTQSHHSFFFDCFCKSATAGSFPYFLPEGFNADAQIAYIKSQEKSPDIPYYRGSLLSRHHIKRSKLINYLLVHSRVNLLPRKPWEDWLRTMNEDNYKFVVSSINGNFSPQLMCPLLYGKVVFSDAPAPANWLGELIEKHKLCWIHRSPRECSENIQQSLTESRRENKLVSSTDAIIRISNRLQLLKYVQLIARECPQDLAQQRHLETYKQKELKKRLNKLMNESSPLAINWLKHCEEMQLTYCNKRAQENISLELTVSKQSTLYNLYSKINWIFPFITTHKSDKISGNLAI